MADLSARVELEIEWAEPPPERYYRSPSHRRKDILDQFRKALLDKPGSWAVFPTDGLESITEVNLKNHARSINKGLSSWSGLYVWEAIYRNGKVYVRYTGRHRADFGSSTRQDE